MLLAHGFLRKVFEIFESYQTSIDMICTSEVGVSVTIDNTKHLNEILDDLKKYGTVTVDKEMCIICVVGDLEWENVGFEAKALDAMRDIGAVGELQCFQTGCCNLITVAHCVQVKQKRHCPFPSRSGCSRQRTCLS